MFVLTLLATIALWISCTSTDRTERPNTPDEPLPESISGVDLGAPPQEISNYCDKATQALDREVPCPRRIPQDLEPGFADLLCSEIRGCFGRDAFGLDLGFRGGLDYRGVDDSEGKVTSHGHLLVWSYPSTMRGDHVRCLGFRRPGGREDFGEVTARWFICPDIDGSTVKRFPVDSGHVILEWREGGYVNGVSFHGHTRANRDLASLLARWSM